MIVLCLPSWPRLPGWLRSSCPIVVLNGGAQLIMCKKVSGDTDLIGR
jgi:hypothetical protein